jgi:predicted HicB family RNase H-like nuclease
MARPLKRNVDIHLRMPADLKKQCQVKAKTQGKTLTEWIEGVLREALRSANHTAGADN